VGERERTSPLTPTLSLVGEREITSPLTLALSLVGERERSDAASWRRD